MAGNLPVPSHICRLTRKSDTPAFSIMKEFELAEAFEKDVASAGASMNEYVSRPQAILLENIIRAWPSEGGRRNKAMADIKLKGGVGILTKETWALQEWEQRAHQLDKTVKRITSSQRDASMNVDSPHSKFLSYESTKTNIVDSTLQHIGYRAGQSAKPCLCLCHNFSLLKLLRARLWQKSFWR
eukprot:SAG31_NODE_1366_length_8621_cov_4.579911_5_plen_184_part_00